MSRTNLVNTKKAYSHKYVFFENMYIKNKLLSDSFLKKNFFRKLFLLLFIYIFFNTSSIMSRQRKHYYNIFVILSHQQY